MANRCEENKNSDSCGWWNSDISVIEGVMGLIMTFL